MKLTYLIHLAYATVLAGSFLRAAEPALTLEEREKVIQLLRGSQRDFLKSVQDLSSEQWSWKPAPDRWSAGEVAEHILLSESALFAKVQEALSNPPNPEWEKKTAGKTEFLEKVMPNRLGRAQAPEGIQPQGKLSRAEIMSRYAEARERTLRFAQETKAALKEHTAEHPFPVFNTLSAWQWLLYIPLHNTRHVKQIEEVKATPGFPQ